MNAVQVSLYGILFALTFLVGWQIWVRNRILGVLLLGGFLIRIFAAAVLETGLKYMFVLDSLAYEREAWLLAQSWTFSGVEFLSLPDGFTGRNFYELFLAGIFYFVGKDSFFAVLLNILLSMVTIFLLYQIYQDFFARENQIEQGPGLIMVLLLLFYPSGVMWSATNIRDPLYFFLCVFLIYFVLKVFSTRSTWPSVYRVAGLLGAGICFYGVIGLRGYVGWLFFGGLGLGLVLGQLAKVLTLRQLLVGSLGAVALGLTSWQMLAGSEVQAFLTQIQKTRLSFSNAGLDDFAQSSFALDFEFRSIWDLARFMPVGILHYFFAPFPWEVRSLVQGLSLIEVFAVYLCVWPTLIGIQSLFRRARFETTLIVVFLVVMTAAQATMISNMGTLFRHRTLVFLMLALFAGEGIHALWQKNRKALFSA